jgi:hypothetical protein
MAWIRVMGRLIDRGDAEFWVQRKDAEAAVALAQKEAAIARRDADPVSDQGGSYWCGRLCRDPSRLGRLGRPQAVNSMTMRMDKGSDGI